VRIGLIADTQGVFDVDALIRHVSQAFAGVDEIWHAGDWGTAAVLEAFASSVRRSWSSTATRRTIRNSR
jgi:predicted phosphodiesterase